MVKRRVLITLLTAALCAALLPALASQAGAESGAYTPQNVTAELLEVTPERPGGSARITFTVADLPRSTDTERWQIVVDRKVGDGGWAEVLRMDTAVCLDRHAAGGDAYMLEQVWSESADWDGKSPLSYRVYVILYDAAGKIVAQSAYSRVVTVGLVTSPWAKYEVLQAIDDGLVPESLRAKDLTAPVTREEFCELAVLLYEKMSGAEAAPALPNPFGDTANPEILKAYALGITRGISTSAFAPDALVTREQCATFLFRVVRLILPEDANYDVSGIPDFPDQKDISDWALQAAKYMYGIGVIAGDGNGNFMPRATANAAQAAGYGQATREQAIVMSGRTYRKFG